MTIKTSFKNFFKYGFIRPIPAGPSSAKDYGLSHSKDGCYWLRADPVRLQADHQRVFMRGYAGVELEKKMIEPLLNKLNDLLHQDHLEIIYLTPTQWLLKCKPGSPIVANLTTHSSLDCLDQDISALLPAGENNAYWRRLFTECQMIMQEYANNSLWFWGAGVSQ